MVERNELRQGNILSYNGEYFIVKYLPKGKVIADRGRGNVEFKLEELKPIPLTEEILLKCGFENGFIENDNFSFSIIQYDGWNISYEEKHGYGNTVFSSTMIPYLHQLQNLYFALTGQELNVKL